MSDFTHSTVTFTFVGGIEYRLNKDLVWNIGHPNGPQYLVPAGFTFEVSIPPFLYWLYSPHERTYLKAAALHDHMLENGWDRITAGAQFHQALKSDGVGRIRRLSMWLAVSLWRYA